MTRTIISTFINTITSFKITITIIAIIAITFTTTIINNKKK